MSTEILSNREKPPEHPVTQGQRPPHASQVSINPPPLLPQICGDHTPDQDRAAFQSLQDTILDAFPPEQVVTPSMVQGDYASLFEAVNAGGSCVGGRCGSNGGSSGAIPGVAGGWPLVDDTRGMILFVMDYQTVNLRCRDGVRKVRERKRAGICLRKT